MRLVVKLLSVFLSILFLIQPSQAKFLQVDPVGYQDQMNLYAYCYNDPTNCTDPTGRNGWAAYGHLSDQQRNSVAVQSALAAQNAHYAQTPDLGPIIDFVPVLGDIKGGAEAVAEPTFINITAAGVGLVPFAGDWAAKGIKGIKGTSNAVDVYRAVDGNELSSIMGSGQFSFGPNGAEVKAFVDNYDDASALANQYSQTLSTPYSVVKGQAPQSVINNAERYSFTDVPRNPMEAIAVRDPQQLQQICNIEVCE